MVRTFAIGCWLAMIGGAGGYLWYSGLPKREQEEADQLATYYAQELFSKTLEELTDGEARHVHTLTARHFSA